MYEVDLVGGMLDGQSFTYPDLPPYLYFPYVPEPAIGTLWNDPKGPVSDFEAPKLIYRHVINGLYMYEGITK